MPHVSSEGRNPDDPRLRVWNGGPQAVDVFHRVLGINDKLRNNGVFVVDAVRWIHGVVRVDLSGKGFGRLVLHFCENDDAVRVEVDGPETNLHPHVDKLLAYLCPRMAKTTMSVLLGLLRDDPATEEAVEAAPDASQPARRSMRDRGDAPMPYSHDWQGGPRQLGPWGLFFDEQIFVFSDYTAVNFIVPVVAVCHAEHECMCVTPKIDQLSHYAFSYPRRKTRPVANTVRRRLGMPDQQSAERFKRLSTDMTQLDTIVGATGKLQKAVELAVAGDEEKIVALDNTCLPRVIGEDTERAFTPARSAKHVHCLTKALGYSHVKALYAEELEFGPDEITVLRDLLLPPRHNRAPEVEGAALFDLVGFVEGRDVLELSSLLEACGAKLNATLLPHVDVEVCRRTPRPNVQVRFPNVFFDDLYERVFDELASRSIAPLAPFGFSAAENWVSQVAASLGLDTDVVSNEVCKLREGLRPRWEAIQALARDCRVAFVVDERILPRLVDPEQSFGLSMLDMLQEMELEADVLCFAPDGDVGYAELSLSRPFVRIVPFGDRDQMHEALRDGEFNAVYSDRTYEKRLTRNGKAQFGFSDFEMGFQGALRTLERLVGACRTPFFQRNARFFPLSSP
jgi:Nitrogenase component 1 type Oxidoreductase